MKWNLSTNKIKYCNTRESDKSDLVKHIKKIIFHDDYELNQRNLAIKNAQTLSDIESSILSPSIRAIKRSNNDESLSENQKSQERNEEQVRRSKNIHFLKKVMKYTQRYQKAIKSNHMERGSIVRKSVIIEHNLDPRSGNSSFFITQQPENIDKEGRLVNASRKDGTSRKNK